jgi:pyruvate carboxylase
LSENAEFARKVEQAGLAFVGPTPEVIDKLGDKTKARDVGRTVLVLVYQISSHSIAAMSVGVPIVPGTPGPVAAYTDAESFIKEYGFPGKPYSL